MAPRQPRAIRETPAAGPAKSQAAADPINFSARPPEKIDKCHLCSCTEEYPCRPACKPVAERLCKHCSDTLDYLVQWYRRGPKSDIKALFEALKIHGPIYDMETGYEDD